jgi:hypothetical protein
LLIIVLLGFGFLLSAILRALIEVPGAGDDEPASVVKSPSSAAVAAEVEVVVKEAEALVEMVAVWWSGSRSRSLPGSFLCSTFRKELL